MPSLLGQFFSSIKGSQEDIASMGLVYILQSSKTARDYLGRIIASHAGIDLGPLTFTAQETGEKGERPDISGRDGSGRETLIIEAKFWASLTSNQPVAYLDRLGANSVLVFICPQLREISLRGEIEACLDGFSYEKTGGSFRFDGSKVLFVINWSALLAGLREALREKNESVSDIDQIIGFCEVIDNSVFFPIQDSDMSPAVARRVNSYCDMIDKVVDRLKLAQGITTANYRATAQKYGYTRYFALGEYGFALEVNLKSWETLADTPFWLSVNLLNGNGSFDQPTQFKDAIRKASANTKVRIFDVNQTLFFAIEPKRNAPEESVTNGIIDEFSKVLTELMR
jgi:hypothetical protein